MVQSKLFRAFLFALLALMPFTAMAQQSLSVTNDSAGHLTKFIPDSIKYQVTQLQVAGPLNGNDIKLIQEMKRRDARYGVATLCIGGGQGLAVLFENCR